MNKRGNDNIRRIGRYSSTIPKSNGFPETSGNHHSYGLNLVESEINNNENMVLPSDSRNRSIDYGYGGRDMKGSHDIEEKDQPRHYVSNSKVRATGSAPLPSTIFNGNSGEYYQEDYMSQRVGYPHSYDPYATDYYGLPPYANDSLNSSRGQYDIFEDEYEPNVYYPESNMNYENRHYPQNYRRERLPPGFNAYDTSEYVPFYHSRNPPRMHSPYSMVPPGNNSYYQPNLIRTDSKGRYVNRSERPKRKGDGSTSPFRKSPYENSPTEQGDSWNSSISSLSSTNDFVGNIAMMVTTQNGCRRLQTEIMNNGIQMIELICKELQDDLKGLLMNHYGNYLFQKMIKVASDTQKRYIIDVVSDVLPIAAKNMQGTRCVQTMIDQCRQEDMLVSIINSLIPSQYALSSDCYGNHVIAKCLDAKPVSIRYPLYNAIIMDAARLSKEKYGCAVINKCILIMEDPYRKKLLDKLYEYVIDIMEDDHGNYVIQTIIKESPREESKRFCESILGRVVSLSMQCCSSNVVECVIMHGDEDVRNSLMDELIASSQLKEMLFDSFGNYVIQKALTRSDDEKKKELAYRIREYSSLLESSRSGKNILSKIDDVL